jgi:hypothetical protein
MDRGPGTAPEGLPEKEEEMHRKYVRRGIFALAVVTSLAYSGSRPAAARELGLMERLNRVWFTVTGAQTGAWTQLAGWFGGDKPTKAASTSTNTGDKGWGMDPNGDPSSTWPTFDPSGLH